MRRKTIERAERASRIGIIARTLSVSQQKAAAIVDFERWFDTQGCNERAMRNCGALSEISLVGDFEHAGRVYYIISFGTAASAKSKVGVSGGYADRFSIDPASGFLWGFAGSNFAEYEWETAEENCISVVEDKIIDFEEEDNNV